MIADFGQQQWSCMNFRLSDRTLRSRDRILSFHRNWWKYARPPIILTSAYILACRAGTSSRSHKSRVAWAVSPLGVYMSERQHIYEDLNESSSASPGGSRQLEIPPSLNSKWAASFFQSRWFFTRRWDFNARQDSIVRLFFCRAPIFCKSAWFFEKRQYFSNPPDFLKRAKNFVNSLDFSWLQIFVYIFSIYFLHSY